jgi:hypothetical protein
LSNCIQNGNNWVSAPDGLLKKGKPFGDSSFGYPLG